MRPTSLTYLFILLLTLVNILNKVDGSIVVLKNLDFIQEKSTLGYQLMQNCLTPLKTLNFTNDPNECIAGLLNIKDKVPLSIVQDPIFNDCNDGKQDLNQLIIHHASEDCTMCSLKIGTKFDRKTNEVFFIASIIIRDNEGKQINDLRLNKVSFYSEIFNNRDDSQADSFCQLKERNAELFNSVSMCFVRPIPEDSLQRSITKTHCKKVKVINKSPSFILHNHFNAVIPNNDVTILKLQEPDCSELNNLLCNKRTEEVRASVYNVSYFSGKSKKSHYLITKNIHYKIINPPKNINTYWCEHENKMFKHINYPSDDKRENFSSTSNYNLIDLSKCENGKCSGSEDFCKFFGCDGSQSYNCSLDLNAKHVYLVSKHGLNSFKTIDSQRYTMKKLLDNTGNYNPHSCSNCEFSCDSDVLKINTKAISINTLSVCKIPFCMTLYPNISIVEMHLLRPMMIHEGIITIKLRLKGNDNFIEKKIFCPRVNVCDFSFDFFSAGKWQIPHCYSLWQWFIVIIFSVILILMLKHILSFIYFLLTILLSLLWPLLKIISQTFIRVYDWILEKRNTKNQNEMRGSGINKVKDRSAYLNKVDYMTEFRKARSVMNSDKKVMSKIPNHVTISLILCLLIRESYSCLNINSVSVKSDKCEIESNNKELCTITTSTRLTLSPVGQESCFRLKDEHKSKLIGGVKVYTKSVSLGCKKNNLYYMPKVDIHCSSAFNCHSAGYCSSDYRECNHPKTYTENIFKTPLFKYEHECFRVPRASECFFGSASCMHVLKGFSGSNEINYEVFDCLEWVYLVHLRIEFNNINENKIVEIMLQPNEIKTIEDISFSIVSITQPPNQLFNTCFIKKNKHIAIAPCNKRGEYTMGKIGEIQCPQSFDSLYNTRNCFTNMDLIKVDLKNEYIDCESKFLDPERYFTNATLPTRYNGYLIESTDDIPSIYLNDESILEIQMDTIGLKVSSLTENSKCMADFIEIHGCYSCAAGAMLRVKTYTDFGSTLATLNCPISRFITHFNVEQESKIQNVSFTTSSSMIDETCEIICPGGISKIHIKGDLFFIPDNDNHLNSTISGTKRNFGGIDWSGILHNSFFSTIWIVIALIIGLVFVILFFNVTNNIYNLLFKKQT
ncbi:glycoprotein [coleopteran phenui-related virus 308]|uniref:Glycoprotein n=1 Tax=coleopteran phenui-related virus 308 TaxID=2849708 RepID=A0A7D7EY79_9VIRU|nr:glycoprotein [Coleopteran phenui-related virus OKIAV308]QMP82257.1 glycoprotein [Coleopteran phenui-related virus OKIAV308]